MSEKAISIFKTLNITFRQFGIINLNMNFKERFAGKTTKITKDGDLDANKADFDAPRNGPNIPSRGNSISKKDRQ